MTYDTLTHYAQAAGPRVRYAADAQGHDVPAWAVVAFPMTAAHMETATPVPRVPGESGPAFHARIVGRVVSEMAQGYGDTPWAATVLFMDALPPREWQMQQAQRRALRWQTVHGMTGLSRVWAASRLYEVVHGVALPFVTPEG